MPWYPNDHGDLLWYEDQGTGPAIVLVHGWCMSSGVWRLQLENLSRSFRVIAPDLRGHGRSAPSGDDYGFASHAADIAALFRHLDLHGAVLAGWSMGAQIAMQACGSLRDRLAGLVLIAATPRFVATEGFPHGLGQSEADGMALKLRRSSERALKGFTARMFAPAEIPDETAAAIGALLNSIPIPETAVALGCLEALVVGDERPILDSIDLPVLIINGDRDVICLPEASTYLAERLAQGTQVEFAGCGHAPFLTRCELFDAALADFIRRKVENSR